METHVTCFFGGVNLTAKVIFKCTTLPHTAFPQQQANLMETCLWLENAGFRNIHQLDRNLANDCAETNADMQMCNHTQQFRDCKKGTCTVGEHLCL